MLLMSKLFSYPAVSAWNCSHIVRHSESSPRVFVDLRSYARPSMHGGSPATVALGCQMEVHQAKSLTLGETCGHPAPACMERPLARLRVAVARQRAEDSSLGAAARPSWYQLNSSTKVHTVQVSMDRFSEMGGSSRTPPGNWHVVHSKKWHV